MVFFISMIGVACLGYGGYLKYRTVSQNKKLSQYHEEIEQQTFDFSEQFRLGQEQLESLYGKQLLEISKEIALIHQRLGQIQDGLLPFELQGKEQQIRTLLDKGLSPSDVAKQLKISVTEVLVLTEK